MSIIIHINTAIEHASVSLSKDGRVLGWKESYEQKDHSAFLQPAMRDLTKECGIDLKLIDAVSVINGPGSYTGLRVGLAAAKGLCFALKKPLICLPTLEWLAKPFEGGEYDLIIPMIDARRMEVFTATYNRNFELVSEPVAMILDDNSFSDVLDGKRILFTGNGAHKLPDGVKAKNGCNISPAKSSHANQMHMAEQRFANADFADLIYSEPFYLKPFYSPSKN